MLRRALLLHLLIAFSLTASAQSAAPLAIVLPPRLLANAPAMLAVLGADGHLAPGVAVDIGNGQRITTDATGRASFTAPPDGAFIATSQGVSAAALVDAASLQAAHAPIVAPDVSQRDRFAICGSGFSGDVSADRVTVNGDAAFVLAASPVCVVVLPQSRTMAGPAKIEISANATHATTATSLVALDFIPPNPPLLPGRKGKLFVRAESTSGRLHIVVENHSPGVIRFLRGDTQELRTPGGARNSVPIDVQAIRSGNFAFGARILSSPDPTSAARYLEIAESIAPKSQKSVSRQLKSIAAQLAHHPADAAKARAAIERLASTASGTLRVLLDAAAQSLA